MNRIDRLHAILTHLQSKRRVTAQEMADRFNISLRTVYRDVKKDRAAAKADRTATETQLAALLREEDHFASGRLPPDMTAEQGSLVVAAVASEIVTTGLA